MAKPGVDLFVLGPALPAEINSLTPKAASQLFPAKATTVSIDGSSFMIQLAPGSASNTVLTDALDRHGTAVWTDAEERDDRAPSMAAGACTSLQVSISDASDNLTANVDESYNLTINAGTATLNAHTCWGAMHGLQTFSQLLIHGVGGPHNSFFMDAQTIVDAPHYSYRGLSECMPPQPPISRDPFENSLVHVSVVDTARHFLPLGILFGIVLTTITGILH